MKKIINTILIFGFLFLLLPLNVFAIGQMSKPIVIENALRGEEYEEIVMVVSSEEEEISVNLIAEWEIAPWASFYSMDDKKTPITNIKIPAKSSKNAIVRFLIPEDALNGVYEGAVSVVTVPDELEGTEKTVVSVAQKIPRKVKITVTGDEVKSCKCHIIPKYLGLKKDEPLKINILCHNTGNVKIKPIVRQKISKSGKTILNVDHLFPEDRDYIRPNSSERWDIEWSTAGQDNGQYKTEIKIMLDGEIAKESTFYFAVGFTVSRFLGYISRLGGGNLVLGWFMIGGFFIMLSMILTFAGRKKGFWERLRRR